MRAITALLLLALLSAAPLQAHDGLREQIAAVTAQLASEPSRADLYLRRGDLRRAARELTAAYADLQRAAALDDTLDGLPLAFARLHFDAGRLSEAVTSATRALADHPANVAALMVRARAHAQLHHRAEAVADLTRAIGLAPVPDLVLERARLLEGEPADLDGALAGIAEGLRRIGPVVTLQLEAVELERRLRRFDAAIARIDDLTAGMPRKEPWLARRGALLEEAQRADEALATYRSALDAALALPPRIRATRATSTLIADLHRHIDRLTAGTGSAPATRSIAR